jgi:hypothetical protein
VIAALATVAAAYIGIAHGTHAAGGSDSNCYLSQADAFAAGRTFLAEPLASIAAWPSARATLSPAGFLPSETRPAASVPICPPGLSLMMAPLVRIDIAGESAAFLVVPLLGALCVWLTYELGRSIATPTIGALAAVLLAASPLFLYQLVQPMGDVPAMTWWVAAAVLLMRRTSSGAIFAGLAAAAAIVTRPNLVPLAAVLGLYAGHTSWRRLMAFAAAAAPGVIVVASLNAMRYGSWASTGYGSTEALFSIGNIVPNLIQYPVWLLTTHTPFLALATAAPWLAAPRAHAINRPQGAGGPPQSPAARATVQSDVLLALAMVAAVFACYLAFVIFDVWWYSRFLLPALPFLIVLSLMVLAELARRAFGRPGLAVTVVVSLGLSLWWLRTAVQLHAFDLQAFERHFIDAGNFVANRLPQNAAVLTVKNSGSVRFYSGRPTITWDSLEAGALDGAVDSLRQAGYAPYLLLEWEEEQPFKDRFRGHSALAELDWPPLARVGTAIRVYDPADRQRFFRGDTVSSDRVWSPVERERRRPRMR